MKKIFLPVFLFLTAAACSDRSLDADIVKVFERHSYEAHPPQKIADALKSRGAGGLAALDSHAAVVKAVKKIEKLPGAVSSGRASERPLVREEKPARPPAAPFRNPGSGPPLRRTRRIRIRKETEPTRRTSSTRTAGP